MTPRVSPDSQGGGAANADRRRPGTQGRGWAYTGALLGGLVSVAANIAHARIPAHPHTGSVLFAAFWPVFLFVAIEILSRTRWPHGYGWGLLRFGGLSAVAVFAAVVSYRHLSGLLTYYGEDTITSRFGPLAVDGLMVMATGALIATSQTRHAVTETVTAAPAADVTPDTGPDTRPPPKPTPRRTDTATAVARLRTRHPDMTQAAIAQRLGVSRSAVAARWKRTTPPTTLSPVKEA